MRGHIYRILVLSIFCFLLLSIDNTTQAKIIEVNKDDIYFTEGNNLTLLKEPKVESFSVSSNIEKERIKIHSKDKNSNYVNGGIGFISTGAYKTHSYYNFQSNYGAISFSIKNVKSTDTVDIMYENVGLYEGKPINLKIHLSDINYKKRYGVPEDTVYFDFSESPFSGYAYYNVSHASIEYSFYYSDTKEIIDVEGNSFLTFNSLNGYDENGTGEFYNYLNFDTSKSNSEVDAYVIKDTNLWLKTFSNLPYKKPIYIGKSNDFEDKLGSDTFTKNSISFQIKGKKHKFVFGSGNRNSAWNAVSSAVLFKVTASDPVKSVFDSSGDNINGEEVRLGQEIIYEVGQKVNVLGQDILEKYSSFILKDNLPEEVEYKNAALIDSKGKVIKNAGRVTYNREEHSVKFVANEDFLENIINYNGEKYSLKIYTNVVEKNLSNSKEEIKIENDAVSIINGIEKHSNKVVNKVKLYNVNIKHIYKKNNKVLKEENDTKHNGEVYHYKPLENIKYNEEYYYKTISSEAKGVINSKDVEIIFYYEVPRFADIGIKKIQIFTDKYTEGLPVNVFLDVKYLNANTQNDLRGKNIELKVHEKDTDTIVFHKNYDLSKLDNFVIRETIPSDYLVKNNNVNYIATIETEDDEEIIIGESKIDTDGYTASELDIKISTSNDDIYKYKGVIMTEREIGKEMNIYYETLILPTHKHDSVKSGYGVTLNKEITYSNELNKITTIGAKMLIDPLLLDSFIEYEQKEGYAIVNMQSEELINDGSTIKQKFTLPKVYVEQKTGNLFSKDQIEANDERIKHELYDGGNKLYIPIWIDELGDYTVKFENKQPVGVNQVDFSVKDSINIYAYMFGHIGSETLDKDEILIEPVNLENPFPNGLPSGWDAADINWFKNN